GEPHSRAGAGKGDAARGLPTGPVRQQQAETLLDALPEGRPLSLSQGHGGESEAIAIGGDHAMARADAVEAGEGRERNELGISHEGVFLRDRRIAAKQLPLPRRRRGRGYGHESSLRAAAGPAQAGPVRSKSPAWAKTRPT